MNDPNVSKSEIFCNQGITREKRQLYGQPFKIRIPYGNIGIIYL